MTRRWAGSWLGAVAWLMALLVSGGGGGTVPTPPLTTATSDAVPVFTVDGARLAPGATLRLAAFGRADAPAPVEAVAPVTVGMRTEYRHGDAVEWYVQQGGGIEQGVTLATRPAGDGPLALTIATPGAATVVDEAGDAAALITPTGRFRYDGLHVTDAAGQVLPSRLVGADGGGIGITVEDAGAVYPVAVDPFMAGQTLTNPDPNGSTSSFGLQMAVSADGNTLVVGYTPFNNPGHAYVYTRANGNYILAQTLIGPHADPYGSDDFGSTVAISGDGNTLVVGATGVSNGKGAAYVYTRANGSYTLAQTLTSPNTSDSGYGAALAISADGNTLVVVAAYASGGGRSVNVATRTGSTYTPQILPNPNDANFGSTVAISGDGNTLVVGAGGSNRAYVYIRTGSNFPTAPTQTLADPGGASGDGFGSTMAISTDGNTLALGAEFANVGGSVSGNVYVYTRTGSSYTPQTLNDPAGTDPYVNNGDDFGKVVTVSGDGNTLVVGALYAGANQNQGGVAYVYRRTGSSYPTAPAQTLTDPNRVLGDRFGEAVAVSGNGTVLLVAAPGVNNSPGSIGSIYTFLNPSAPAITSITPSAVGVGDPAFTLTVTGSGFVNGSTVRLNGTNLTTTYVSATELQAQVPASALAAAGMNSVTVVNGTPGGGVSNAVTLTVAAPQSGPQPHATATAISATAPAVEPGSHATVAPAHGSTPAAAPTRH